jgi:hypothetical protein
MTQAAAAIAETVVFETLIPVTDTRSAIVDERSEGNSSPGSASPVRSANAMKPLTPSTLLAALHTQGAQWKENH